MRKTYIAPKMETIEINLVSMIATSDPKVYTTTLSAGEAESRRGFYWDEDED